MARVLGVSQSGYYKWFLRKEKGADAKKEEEAVALEILALFQRSRGSFGSRKITRKLNETGERVVNHKKVERIMREKGLFAKSRKKYLSTTNSRHSEWIADNLLNRDFTAEKPKQRMVSDTTVVPTKEGNLYVAGILDLYARMPVGIAMSPRNDSQLVKDALEDLWIRGGAEEGCILHSDRGSTYASKEYRIMLSKYGFLCSMSRKGDCWDNAPMESFWGKLKTEWLKEKYDTIQEAARDIYEYVWMFYPNERPNQALGYRTPSDIYSQAERT